MIQVKRAFPLMQVPSPVEAARFYVEHFGFETVFEADWYVQLQSGSQELGFIAIGHDSIPAERRQLASHVCLTLEVEDVDAAHAEVADKMQIKTSLRDEAWGQRHFLGYDPVGIMLDVVRMLEPSDG